MNNKIIFVSPGQREPVQGYGNLTWTIKSATGETISKTPFRATKAYSSYKQPKDMIMFPINHTKRKLETGLEQPIVNPYKGMTVNDLRSKFNLNFTWNNEMLETVCEADNISKQTYLEIKHGVNHDHYTSHLKTDTIFTVPLGKNLVETLKNQTPSFLQTFKYSLYDKDNMIQGGTPRNDLALELVKVHPLIATSSGDYNSAIHRYYISEENQERAAVRAKSSFYNRGIYELVRLLAEYSSEVIYKVASLLTYSTGVPLIQGDVSNQAVEDKLNDYLNQDRSDKVHNFTKFLSIVKMLQDKESKSYFEVNYIFQQALNYKVIVISKGKFIWASKKSEINVYDLGTSKDKVIQFFLKEYEDYNPSIDTINWYGELLEELKKKGAKVS